MSSVNTKFLYKMLSENIENQLRTGKLKVGDLVPSETKLQSEYNMSRVTVRKAIMELEQRGLITRKHGKGTYVSNTTVHQSLANEASTIVEAFENAGIELSVEALGIEYIDPPDFIADLFCTTNQKIVCLKRKYFTEEATVGIVSLYFPLALSGVAYILNETRNSKETSYDLFEKQLHLKIGLVKYEIKALPACASNADKLGIYEGDTCLTMDRITRNTAGVVIEFARFVYAPDSASFEITLPRHASPDTLKFCSGNNLFDCPI